MQPDATSRKGQMGSIETQRVLNRYEGRERQLWSIIFMILITVATGFAVVVSTTVLRDATVMGPYSSQLAVGFAVLVALLNVYIVLQRRALKTTRADLLEQLIRVEQAIAESFIDPLTGLFNRRYLDYFLEHEAKRVTRSDGKFALLMVDVNGFKSINDRHGHLEGDRFLQEVARALKKIFRDSDTLMRYGGDEFVVLMPDTPEENLHRVIQRLRDGVAAWNEASRPIDHTMSLSCGVACFSKGDTVDAVLALADQRMYEDKRSLAESGMVAG